MFCSGSLGGPGGVVIKIKPERKKKKKKSTTATKDRGGEEEVLHNLLDGVRSAKNARGVRRAPSILFFTF